MAAFAQHVGLGEYSELFAQHELGRPMLELLNEDREIWPELFASDLSAVRHVAPIVPARGVARNVARVALPERQAASEADFPATDCRCDRSTGSRWSSPRQRF